MKISLEIPRERLNRQFLKAKGFTLVELLGVIGVMIVLLSLTAPLVTGMRGAGQMSHSVAQMASLLEQARAYAMANNTYVWVGFEENTAQSKVKVAVVASLTGAASDYASASTRQLIGKIYQFENLRLHELEEPLTGMEAAELVDASMLGEFTESRAGTSLEFGRLVRFDPAGGARIKEDEITRWVEISMEPMQGNVPNRANGAALQIAGLTGKVRIFRP